MTPAPQAVLPRTRHRSLRLLLAVAALAALLTAAVLGTLLLMTANSARNVVMSAHDAHDRVQAYSLLISAARGLQSASYSTVRNTRPEALAELESARTRFFAAVEGVQRLPQRTQANRDFVRSVVAQSERVADHLAHALESIERIDQIWRTEGSAAAGVEANRNAEPVRELERLLNGAIRRGDATIEAATSQALSLGKTVVVVSVLFLVLSVVSWGIVNGLLLRRLGTGLARLEAGSLAFAAGNLDHRVRLEGQDELARLSQAFDTMAGQLAEKQRSLQEIQVNLERAVRERTEELERANRELSVSDARRRAFLADIGHELRTPLTIIRGEAQVALRTIDRPGFNAHDAFERIIKHVSDLGRMVEDLFLIARAEAGGLPMQVQEVDLRELAARVAGDFEALVVDSDASIRAVPGVPVRGIADPDRLRRALAALIDNALRHTHGAVQVEIDARRTARGVEISVADDGPGIAPDLVPELFQRFRRGHTKGEGSGLGLSLVRALVEAQGGRARIENRAEGGTRAVLELPAAPVHVQEVMYESAAG